MTSASALSAWCHLQAACMKRTARHFMSWKPNLREQLNVHGFVVVRGVLEQKKINAALKEVREFFKSHDLTWRRRLWERNEMGGMMALKASDLNESEGEGDSTEYVKLNKVLLDLHTRVDSTDMDDIYNITLPPNVDSITQQTVMNTSLPVFDILTDAALLDCVRHALGMDDVSEIDTVPIQQFRMKPPVNLLWTSRPLHASTGTTGWHQDRFSYHPGADAVEVFTCWTSLVDVNREMGPLQVLPGSHTLELQNHIPEPEHPDECSIPLSVVQSLTEKYGMKVETLTVNAGDLVLLDPLLMHCALPNVSGRCRISMDSRYCAAGQASARPWFPSFNVSTVTHKQYAASWSQAQQDLLKNEPGKRLPQINRFQTPQVPKTSQGPRQLSEVHASHLQSNCAQTRMQIKLYLNRRESCE